MPDDGIRELRARSARTVTQARWIAQALQMPGHPRRRRSTGARNIQGHAYFAMLYRRAVEGWHSYAPGSSHPEFYYRLVPIYFDFYISSVVRRLTGESQARKTPLWDAYFKAVEGARPGSPRALMSALYLGSRAHILGDLPEAALLGVRESGLQSSDRATFRLFERPPGGSRIFSRVAADFLDDLEAYHRSPACLKEVGRSRLKSTIQGTLSALSVLPVQHWRQLAWRRAARMVRKGG